MDIMNKKGNIVLIVSEYLDENGKIPFTLVGTNRITNFCISRNHISFNICIKAIGNKKAIRIESSETIVLSCLYQMAMNIIRFENLFEGRFYYVTSIKLDNNELLTELEKHFLGYMTSKIVMSGFYIKFNDKSYKKYFIAFEKLLKKKILQYHIFLYATYLMGMTADLRMSMLIELFEPLMIEFSKAGRIRLNSNPYLTKSVKCTHCGKVVTIQVKNKGVHLSDYLRAAIRNYGNDIFTGDSVAKIVRKAVNLRNSVFHVENKKDILKGPECAHYLYKFSLLYRIIVMQELGIPYNYIQARVKVLTEDFNNRFPNQRILP